MSIKSEYIVLYWDSIRYLGSRLDTDKDIKSRKGLAIQAENKLKYILDSKKLEQK